MIKKISPIILVSILLAGCALAPKAAPKDMVWIPKGEFQMGCDPAHNGGFPCPEDELPLHTVSVDDFYMDKYEVTNLQYAECVAADGCSLPIDLSSETHELYFTGADYTNYPVVNVGWSDAYAYCKWAGKRLPTEAEWEKAARGSDSRTYAWGDNDPDCSLVNGFNDLTSTVCKGDATAVGSYPDGANSFGLMDMTGNVLEWVHDWYTENYYTESPASNPGGSEGTTNKVLRGGGFASTWAVLRTSNRAFTPSFNSSRDIGFRCAKSTNAE